MSAKLTPPEPLQAKEFFERKMKFTTGPVELDRAIKEQDNVNVIDVRAAEDFVKGHIPGAKSLPQDHWGTAAGLSKDKVNVLYCYSHVCHLAASAAVQLAGKGFPVMEMDGGFEAWEANELQVEKGLQLENSEGALV